MSGLAPWVKKLRYGQRSLGISTTRPSLFDQIKNMWDPFMQFSSYMSFRSYREKMKQKGV